ncbi:hypothetical protein GF336_07855 [Candidatus Woesearchaeota archaeon]|nr:hypothetical protein [Candidatus Woesearchaeota archaeon]
MKGFLRSILGKLKDDSKLDRDVRSYSKKIIEDSALFDKTVLERNSLLNRIISRNKKGIAAKAFEDRLLRTVKKEEDIIDSLLEEIKEITLKEEELLLRDVEEPKQALDDLRENIEDIFTYSLSLSPEVPNMLKKLHERLSISLKALSDAAGDEIEIVKDDFRILRQNKDISVSSINSIDSLERLIGSKAEESKAISKAIESSLNLLDKASKILNKSIISKKADTLKKIDKIRKDITKIMRYISKRLDISRIIINYSIQIFFMLNNNREARIEKVREVLKGNILKRIESVESQENRSIKLMIKKLESSSRFYLKQLKRNELQVRSVMERTFNEYPQVREAKEKDQSSLDTVEIKKDRAA